MNILIEIKIDINKQFLSLNILLQYIHKGEKLDIYIYMKTNTNTCNILKNIMYIIEYIL